MSWIKKKHFEEKFLELFDKANYFFLLDLLAQHSSLGNLVEANFL